MEKKMELEREYAIKIPEWVTSWELVPRLAFPVVLVSWLLLGIATLNIWDGAAKKGGTAYIPVALFVVALLIGLAIIILKTAAWLWLRQEWSLATGAPFGNESHVRLVLTKMARQITDGRVELKADFYRARDAAAFLGACERGLDIKTCLRSAAL